MIRAYPGRPSVPAGETLTLHVSGDEPRFRIAIYRWESTSMRSRRCCRTTASWSAWATTNTGATTRATRSKTSSPAAATWPCPAPT